MFLFVAMPTFFLWGNVERYYGILQGKFGCANEAWLLRASKFTSQFSRWKLTTYIDGAAF